jgi:hypothetical protein
MIKDLNMAIQAVTENSFLSGEDLSKKSSQVNILMYFPSIF